MALAGCGGDEAGPKLALSAALPDAPADGTVLRVGDPATQVALETSGLIDDLDVEVEWANISGGPKTLEAFRADAIDIGSVADIPPLFAHWTGTDVRIVAARETVDPEEHPTYELGVAPGVDVSSIEDLKGKKIAYSPGQAQGALVLNVLREAGLTQDDVEFVEMQSVDDAFSVALAGKQVDVAPLGQTLAKTYLAKYEQSTAPPRSTPACATTPGRSMRRPPCWRTPTRPPPSRSTSPSGRWPSSGSPSTPTSSPRPTTSTTRACRPRTRRTSSRRSAPSPCRPSWDEFIARHQETVDTLVEAQDQEPLDVETLYDRRFEKAIATGGGGLDDDPDRALPAGPAAARPRTYVPCGAASGRVSRSASEGSSASPCCWRRGSSVRPPACSTRAT